MNRKISGLSPTSTAKKVDGICSALAQDDGVSIYTCVQRILKGFWEIH